MTHEERNRKHAQNRELADLSKAIPRHEDQLTSLYADRAGRVEWSATGQIARAWCTCCGRNEVYPNQGQDTCPDCLANI